MQPIDPHTSSSEPALALIVAVAENDVIGCDGELPWHQSSDLKRFRQLTMGKPIIMGRKTFASIGKPLDGRENIVVSRNPAYKLPGVIVVTSPEAALAAARKATRDAAEKLDDVAADGEIMVIGGAQLYAELLPNADRIYLTRVHCRPEGDAYFPYLDPAQWHEVSRETLKQGARDDWPATLIVLERTNSG